MVNTLVVYLRKHTGNLKTKSLFDTFNHLYESCPFKSVFRIASMTFLDHCFMYIMTLSIPQCSHAMLDYNIKLC